MTDSRHPVRLTAKKNPLDRASYRTAFAAQILLVSLMISPLTAQACAVCFGNKDSLQTKGAMAGVFFLLMVITAVLTVFAVTFIRWGQRERALQEKLGPASSAPGHS